MIKNVIFIFVVLTAILVVYLPSYVQMQALRNRNQNFERRIKELEASNLELTKERDRLKNDPEYLEKIARERMGIIKEDEVIYKVVAQGTKQPEMVSEIKKPKAVKVVKKAVVKKKKPAVKKKKNNKQ